MNRRRKRVRLLSTSESDSEDNPPSQSGKDILNEKDAKPQRSTVDSDCGYGSDGNSSVESMDIIMYPSASLMSKIQTSKLKCDDSNKEKLKYAPQKSLAEKSTKLVASDIKNKKTVNKRTKLSKKVLKHSESTTNQKCENKVRKNVNINVHSGETKNSNPNLVTSVNIYVNHEKRPDPPKISTVKKRTENYGSRLNFLMADLMNHSNNKKQSSNEKKERLKKSKDQYQNRCKKMGKNSETKINNQSSELQSVKKDSRTESLSEFVNEEQFTSVLSCSKDLNHELGHSSKSYDLPQNSNPGRLESTGEFHETLSQPPKSLKFKNLEAGIYNQSSKKDQAKRNLCTKSLPEVRNESLNYNWFMIKTIVNFDTKWLKEKEKEQIKKPPLELNEESMKYSFCFKNFDSYYRRYLLMLETEVWEKICLDAKATLSNTNKNNFTFSVDSFDYDFGQREIMRLNCRSAVHVPVETSLVIVTLNLENGRDKSVFGFIGQLGCEENKDLNETKGSHRKAPVKELVFKMFVKQRKIVPKLNLQMEGKFVCSLYKETKQAEALDLMQFSPLLREYLMPTWDTFSTPHSKYNTDFFNVQLNIFDVVSHEINLSPSKPKIMLLQGPPGSGKTSAIITIASNLLRNKNEPKKILIVAPSHFALDEIGNQLLNLNESFIDPISFVRLGQIENIHHKLLEYSLPRYLEKGRINGSQNIVMKGINEGTLKDNPEQLQIRKILSDTSLILAVPEDCWQLHKFEIKFSCCFIDEVNQSTELDTLYPFALGINKFLLVADHKQLPANVESETFRQLGYQKSVMERFQSYFLKQLSKNPTILLSQTFRLNACIANFPFKRFYSYSNHHEMCLYAYKRSIFSSIKPYVVLDDQSHHGNRESLYIIESGVNFIISLCNLILNEQNTLSIGIIVPSLEEQRVYQTAIAKLPSSNVEVNTIDKFQGREKAVIILSVYHDFKEVVPSLTNYFSEVRKLNVALTRATNSLIICGPLQKTLQYDIWSDIVTDSQNRKCYFGFKSQSEVQLSHVFKDSDKREIAS